MLQDDEAARFANLACRFCQIVDGCCGSAQAEPGTIAAFDAGQGDTHTCGERVVEGFSTSLRQDGAAARVDLRLPWGSGRVKGQVDRLKLLKRCMYGHAKLDLLRRRLLVA